LCQLLYSVKSSRLPQVPIHGQKLIASLHDGSNLHPKHLSVTALMTLRIVRLGSPRASGEGTRVGAVRYPPRGVPKERYVSENWFDVWYPDLAPSKELMARAKSARSPGDWTAFTRAFQREMSKPIARRALDLLAALSHNADFSIGCYCEDESRCHRSVLRKLLTDRGALITPR
jgi:uncharacterized protein YeaO (DUF488 family)